MRGTHADGFEILKALCGRDTYSRIFLATSWWQICDAEEGAKREQELRDKIWAHVLDCPNSAHMSRLENTPTSAWNLVEDILAGVKGSGKNGQPLKVQREMVDEKKKLPKTDVGRIVNVKSEKGIHRWIEKLRQFIIF